MIAEEKLIAYAKEINNCFDNGCGCCSKGDDDIGLAIAILKRFAHEVIQNIVDGITISPSKNDKANGF